MVISTVNQVIYNGDGITTAWPFTFRIIDATDIKLLLIDADGTETDVSADYYVDMVNNTVYYPGYAPGAEPPEEDQPPKVQTGQKLVVYRELPITQEKDLGDKWPFYVIELGLDKLTMILQQIFDWWGRTLKISQGGSVDGFDTNVYPEAGKVISVNEDGDGFEGVTAMTEKNNAWDGRGMQIKSVAGPTDNTDAATKGYVDGYADGNFMKLQPDGTAWEGRNIPISNVANPVSVHDSATKEYVDNLIDKLSVEADRYVVFNTVAAMIAADLPAGYNTRTLGYHDVNDGGASIYSIRGKVAGEMEDGRSVIFLANGNVAERIYGSCMEVVKGDPMGSWKVYTSAVALGLSYETMNLDKIYRAMPIYSMAIIYLTQGAVDFRRFPLPYYGTSPDYYGKGVLFIRKTRTTGQPVVGHCEFKDEARNGKQRKWVSTFVGEYNADNPQLTDYTWSGWEEISAKPIDMQKNPQRCVDELVEVAESYYNKGIKYGTIAASADNGSIKGFDGTPTDMNCKLFVNMALEGIPYYRSKWFKGKNSLRYLNAYSWSVHPPRDWYEFIKWFWQNGWEIDPGINYGNLQKGDIVFYGGYYDRWGQAGSTDTTIQEDREEHFESGEYIDTASSYWKDYREVSHVGILTGRWLTDSQGNKHPQIIQCTGYRGELPGDDDGTGGIRYDYLESQTIISHQKQYLVMFARVPLCETKAFSTTNYDSVVRQSNCIFSHYHKADITIKGNGQDIIININTRNLAKYDEIEAHGINTSTGEDNTASDRACTGYIPYDPSDGLSIDVPNGFHIVSSSIYYDKNKVHLPDSEGAAYRRYLFSKTDSTTVTSEDLLNLRNGLVIVHPILNTQYARGYGNNITISSATIPNGYTCKRWQGHYCISNDNTKWTPLDSSANALLDSLYLYDGDNYIRILNNQEVEII